MRIARPIRGILGPSAVIVIALVCQVFGAVGQQVQDGQREVIGDRLAVNDFTLLRLALPSDPAATIVVPITLDNVSYTLVLDRYSLRSADFRVLVAGPDGTLRAAPVPDPQTYRGALLERPDSRSAASVTGGQLAALIVCDDAAWGVQPLTHVQPDADPALHVVYRLQDLRPIGGVCGVDFLPPVAEPEAGVGGGAAGGFPTRGGCTQICEIAFDADVEFFQRNGSSVPATVADIENVLNGVETIYERDVNITYQVTTVIVRQAEPDPYTSTDPGTLLSQFQSEWRNHQSGVVRDVAHLMTGKELDGGVIGIAYLGVVCSTSQGYGLSQSRFTTNLTRRVGLTAHEVGHNWNAVHCDGDTDCYIMCSVLGGCSSDLTRFGTRSISAISAFSDSRPCLTDDGPVILTQPQSQTACAGDTVVFSVTVDAFLPSYQWRIGTTPLVDDGTHIIGATSSTLAIVGATEADEAGDYNCVVTDAASGCAVTTNNAALTVDPAPLIFGQPADQTVTEGGYASFAVTVDEPISKSFQWRRDGAALSEGGRFYGTTSATLAILPVQLADAGQYDCVVTSLLSGCSATSDAATLTVEPAGNPCPADLTGDGQIDLADLSLLLSNYGTPSGADPQDGDIDDDGDVDLADLSALLAAYGTTCD